MARFSKFLIIGRRLRCDYALTFKTAAFVPVRISGTTHLNREIGKPWWIVAQDLPDQSETFPQTAKVCPGC